MIEIFSWSSFFNLIISLKLNIFIFSLTILLLEDDTKLEPNSNVDSNSSKRQLINLDRFQVNENEHNFSQISSSLMEIMYDMITVLPDFLINEILNLLKYESFIMFAMVS